MGGVLLFGRVALAVLFAVAGVAKLADRSGSRQALDQFGAPVRLAGPLAVALPLVELAIAAALLPRATAAQAALAALALLGLLSLAIAVNLALGRNPDCHCFGQLHSEPAGWKTLARNGALATVAAFVAWEGWSDAGSSALVLVDWARPAELVALVFAVVAIWFGYQLLRQQGRLLVRIEALEAGLAASAARPLVEARRGAALRSSGGPNGSEPRPRLGLPIGSRIEFRLPALDGGSVALSDYRGKRVLLVHWSPHCGFCDLVAAELAALERDLRRRNTELVFASYGEREVNRPLVEDHRFRAQILLQDGSPLEAFEGLGTPSAYLVDEGGRVARPLAVGANDVPELAREAARSGTRRGSKLDVRPLPAGSSAPAFTLPDLKGHEVSLATFRGRSVLLLFSDPQCGACDDVTAEFVRLARTHNDNGVAFVIVGRGDEQANRAKLNQHAIEFPYLLQREWTVAEAYGTYAVPTAFLVDEGGRIARDAAMGTDRILALTRWALPGGGG